MHYRASLFDSSADHTTTTTGTSGGGSRKERSSAEIRRGLTVDSGGGGGGGGGDLAAASSAAAGTADRRHRATASGGAAAAPFPVPPALPGRPRRRRAAVASRHQRRHGLALGGNRRWWRHLAMTICRQSATTGGSFTASMWAAALLWYALGIVSIATSKVLLTGGGIGSLRVSPLALTLQQLLLGSTWLRCLLRARFLGSSEVSGWSTAALKERAGDAESASSARRELFMAAICFAVGFLATNYGFAGSAASFVETVKAAEPLTSAAVAAVYGIEAITVPQKASLATIVAGVLLSTFGHGGGSASAQTMSDAVLSCAIVMTSNLCFSFRSLFQKLFRRRVSAQALDDLNLQFRMQWLGALLLFLPTLILDFLPSLWYKTMAATADAAPLTFTERYLGSNAEIPLSAALSRYCLLALLNGFAFTSYNLASSYILSRISVVHHAALNCIRRVFAIIVTSVLFQIPITVTGAAGICLAVIGFMAYTHYKQKQQQSSCQPLRHTTLPLSSLLPVSVTQ